MKKANKLNYFITSILFLSLFALFSCKMKAEQKSLTTHFEIIDSFIDENLLKDAISELKKTEKQCYDSWSYIGVYKRYIQIGENAAAEKVLKNAIKKNQKNEELLAVYTQFLLRNGKYEDACNYSEILCGTKYGSLYSEAVFQKIKKEINSGIELNKDKTNISTYYKNPKYYSIYFDAYKNSLNPVWIRNCAIFNLEEGYFDIAASLLPTQYANADDAYFWALVLYDSGKYHEAIHALEGASLFLDGYSEKTGGKSSKVTSIKLAALESDAYLAASDFENAEIKRKKLINSLDELNSLSTEDEELLPVLVLNSAIYALNIDDENKASELLLYSVDRWPYYSPSLILYSDFAFNSNIRSDEDEEEISLRKAGLSTLKMEKYDNRTKIPISDALYRLQIALEQSNDPKLYIKQLDLKYKMQTNYSVKEKTADLWNILEESYNKNSTYESLLLQYILSYLLQTKQIDDAYMLFQKYIVTTYDLNKTENFWEQFEKIIPMIDVKLVEFGAWFSAYYKLYDETIRFYEYCVYESSGILADNVVSPKSSVQACMNLADIYFSTGKTERALDLYGKAAGRESSKYIRSEIFYRIACVYNYLGDEMNALHSIDYSISLYPGNARAALLKSKF